jgi:hypothetical protein
MTPDPAVPTERAPRPARARRSARGGLHRQASIAKRTRTWQRQITASIAQARAHRRRPEPLG